MATPRESRSAVCGEAETLPWAWAEERLASARNFWLATSSPEQGPHSRPVWGLWTGGGLLFTSSRTSRKARDFLADPRISVHPELVREVVVVDGEVEEAHPSEAEVAAYDEKYGWTPPGTQTWFVVRPRRASAWDEATYPAGATDYAF